MKDPLIISATETGTPPPNREEVGDRIIIAKMKMRVDNKEIECFMYAEEYNSDDVLGCDSCSDGEGKGPGCDDCDHTGHADANSFSVALGMTEDAAREAHAEGEDEHYVAPCWCGNHENLNERAAWLAWQANDAGLTPRISIEEGEEDE